MYVYIMEDAAEGVRLDRRNFHGDIKETWRTDKRLYLKKSFFLTKPLVLGIR